ncbi:2-oxo acid dehydrogenase subunit E2 [Lacinutrix neustonica]|uniref:2-oxo acid dehydrogenase subunit E2 n=1 Tax=Lacinutrix neustonica TaxID=2980107 RepID=A0A9E8MYS0_9FLAO|nr:2-oxo acid dehydrogenase subunit E2 [Lacinutrix neustonica]WAC03496.1 2-oxo acid dehydrogenase subunit E2 [Lacinutrix neustonica]
MTKQVNDLAARARDNKLKPDDIQGGTYTVTNVGTFGSIMGTPIINQPQVGILALGAIRKVPAVIETPRWRFYWDTLQNVLVTLLRSSCGQWGVRRAICKSRKRLFRGLGYESRDLINAHQGLSQGVFKPLKCKKVKAPF